MRDQLGERFAGLSNATPIPTVYFTDSSGACYHTTQDEFDIVDFDKLEKQASLGTELVRDLANRASAPALVEQDAQLNEAFGELLATLGIATGSVPPPTYADAEQLIAVAEAAVSDSALDEFPDVKSALQAQLDALRSLPRADAAQDGLAIALASSFALQAIGELPCRSYR